MTKQKKRPSIGRHNRKTGIRKRTSTSTRTTASSHSKRKLQQTPLKSPYKSPFYKSWRSPATKRFRKAGAKSPRKLFLQTDNQSLNPSRNKALDDEFGVLSSTLSVSDNENETVEDLPDDSYVTDQQSSCPISTDNDTSTMPESENIQKMKYLLPVVMESLSKCGMDEVMASFFEMVAAGTYPLDNIAFLLWAEVVKWFELSTTTRMRYSNETKMFWKLGWRLFGKRFLNFMGGFKSHGVIVLNATDKGKFDPHSSECGYVVFFLIYPETNINFS